MSEATPMETPRKRLPPVCRKYNQKKGCPHFNCQELHLCYYSLLDRCTISRCARAHSLATGSWNVQLLERLGWRGPEDRTLALDKLRRRERRRAVQLCLNYNYGSCWAADCCRLHLCYRHVLDSCPLDDCVLSHDVKRSQHNINVLGAAGLADTPVSKVLKRVRDNLLRNPPRPIVCRKLYSRPAGCRGRCLRLHCCEAFTLGCCRYGSKCFNSHSLQDRHNQRVLTFFGWTVGRVLDQLRAGR